MNNKPSIIIQYKDEEKDIYNYEIYYNPKINMYEARDGYYVNKIIINENGDVIIRFADTIKKIIHNTSFIKVSDDSKQRVKSCELLVKPSDIPFPIDDATYNTQYDMQDMKEKIKNALECLEYMENPTEEILEKYNFLFSSKNISFEEIISQIARVNVYANIKVQNKKEKSELEPNESIEAIFDYLCIAIIILRKDELDYTKIFEIKPKIIKLMVNKIKYMSKDEIIQLSNHILDSREIIEKLINCNTDKEQDNMLTMYINSFLAQDNNHKIANF